MAQSLEASAVVSGSQEASALALRRSRLYRLLALAFAYPEREAQAALGRLAEAVRAEGKGEPLLGPVLAEMAGGAREADVEALGAHYVAAFGHVTLPDCPLYETACGIADPFAQAQTLADITGFYRAFGLELAPGAGERADHLTVELEFMHYLAYREAFAWEHQGPERAAVIQDGERRFLEAHLGRWAPVVARAAAARAEGLLRASACLLEAFLAEELGRYAIVPALLVTEGEPLMIPPAADWSDEEDDDLTGREP